MLSVVVHAINTVIYGLHFKFITNSFNDSDVVTCLEANGNDIDTGHAVMRNRS